MPQNGELAATSQAYLKVANRAEQPTVTLQNAFTMPELLNK